MFTHFRQYDYGLPVVSTQFIWLFVFIVKRTFILRLHFEEIVKLWFECIEAPQPKLQPTYHYNDEIKPAPGIVKICFETQSNPLD